MWAKLKKSRLRPFLLKLWAIGDQLYPKHLGVPPTNVPLLVHEALLILEDLGEKEKGVLLDIGGRNAPYRKQLSRLASRYICLDIEPGEMQRVQIIGDALRLPIRNSSIKVAVLFEVLEHLREPHQATHEIARILAPNGLLLVTAPQYWHIHGWPSDYFRFTNHGLMYLCQQVGFDVVKMWRRGGPCILLSLVMVNTFNLNGDPLRRVFIGVPLTWVCYVLDSIFFSTMEDRKNPDTRGWALIARKPPNNTA